MMFSDHRMLIKIGTFLGFLGKVLIEKLLYSCSDVKQLIILMRPKRGKNARQRVDDFLKLEVSHNKLIHLPFYDVNFMFSCSSESRMRSQKC